MKRKSFASIEQKLHPSINKFNFDFSNTTLDSKKNEPIVDSLLSFFSKKIPMENDGTGEWNWLQKNKQNNFILALQQRKKKLISKFLTNMFRNEATYGYLSPSFSDAILSPESVKSDILCNIDSCLEFSDIGNLLDLTSDFGNPYGLMINERFILPDTPRHYYYGYNIFRMLEDVAAPNIIEIGGGYGGACLQNWKRFKGNCTIINIDLFPALVVAYFYLKKNGIPLNLVTEQKSEIKKNAVNFIFADEMKNLQNKLLKCDLIFNSRSLCEMDEVSIEEYFNFINSINTKYFYHENSNFILFPNSKRHVEVVADKFPINMKKFKLISKYLTPFTGGGGRYREYLYKAS